MLSRRLLLLTLVATTVAPAAHAATTSPPVEIARDGALVLTAHDDQGRVCLAFEKSNSFAEGCLEAEQLAAATIPRPTGAPTQTPEAVGAVVPAGATSVEVRRAGVVLGTASTVSGDRYHGKAAGKVRFALVRLPAGVETGGLRVRALDATGALLAVAAPAFSSELITRKRVLLSGRVRGVRWTITGSQHSELASSVADPANEVVQQCISVDANSHGGGSSVDGNCVSGRGERSLLERLIGISQAVSVCDAGFRLLSGQTPAPLTRVTALLGDGRTVTGRLQRFAAARTTVYAIVVPAGLAVRSVREVGPGRSHTTPVGLPPLSVGCVTGDADRPSGAIFGSLESFTPATVTPGGPVTEVPGSPGFRVADGPDGTLCLAPQGKPFTEFSCQVVLPGPTFSVVAVDDPRKPTVVVGAFPAQVAAFRLRPRGAPARTLATVEAPGYAGRYAGRVRFVAISDAGDLLSSPADELDAAGVVLHTEPASTAGGSGATRGSPRRVAGSRSRPSLWRTRIKLGTRGFNCLALTRGRRPSEAEQCEASSSAPLAVILTSPCTTHRLTIAATAAQGSTVTVRDSRGAQRTLRLRHGAGLLTLPPDRGAVLLIARRRGHKPVPVLLRAPAGERQCGWSAVPDIESVGATFGKVGFSERLG